jgi:hypothetical protein
VSIHAWYDGSHTHFSFFSFYPLRSTGNGTGRICCCSLGRDQGPTRNIALPRRASPREQSRRPNHGRPRWLDGSDVGDLLSGVRRQGYDFPACPSATRQAHPATPAADVAKRRAACEVVNYLVGLPAVRSLIAAPDRLLRRTPQELALAAARQSDEAIAAALRGAYDPRKTYGPLKDTRAEEEGEFYYEDYDDDGDD